MNMIPFSTLEGITITYTMANRGREMPFSTQTHSGRVAAMNKLQAPMFFVTNEKGSFRSMRKTIQCVINKATVSQNIYMYSIDQQNMGHLCIIELIMYDWPGSCRDTAQALGAGVFPSLK